MADRQFTPGGTEQAPFAWTVDQALQLIPKTAYALFDGTAAGSAFFPCLRVISDSGHVAYEAVSTTQVAAGGSAAVSWFRGVRGGASSASGGSGPDVLFDQTLTGSAGTITTGAGGLAQTNRDLLIVTYLRTDEAIDKQLDGAVFFNADNAAAHYKSVRLSLVPPAITSVTGTASAGFNCFAVVGASSDAGAYAASFVYIPSYTEAVQHAGVGLEGAMAKFADTTTWFIGIGAHRHNQAVAITEATVTPNIGGGANFVAGSRVIIYGLG